LSSSLVNFPQYIHLRDLLVVDHLFFVISGCHNTTQLNLDEADYPAISRANHHYVGIASSINESSSSF